MFEYFRHHRGRFYTILAVSFVAGTALGAIVLYFAYAKPLADTKNHRVVLAGEGYFMVTTDDELRIENNPIFWKAKTKEKVVALTFDDGPHPTYSQRILDVLKREGVKATFFVVGKEAKKYQNIIKKEAAAGNEIENHSYSHPQFSTISDADILREINMAGDTIEAITGRRPTFFRPPKGLLGVDVTNLADANGYEVVLWSASLERALPTAPKENALRLASEVQPGYIILAHDGRLDRSATVEALPYLIDELKNKGYRFVTLSQMYALDKAKKK